MRKKTWYSPREITFSRRQMVDFLLPNLEEMRLGTWPEGETTGYEGKNFSGRGTWAPHEVACSIAGEVDARLLMIGEQSRIVEPVAGLEFTKPFLFSRKEWREYEQDICRIAKLCNMDRIQMLKEYNRMVLYISGWKRPNYSYKEWKIVSSLIEGLDFSADPGEVGQAMAALV